MKRTIVTLTVAGALALVLTGCISVQEHGPNGLTCQTNGHVLPFYGHVEKTCTDATGNVVSTDSTTVY